jgi:hypothetical protein
MAGRPDVKRCVSANVKAWSLLQIMPTLKALSDDSPTESQVTPSKSRATTRLGLASAVAAAAAAILTCRCR